MERYRMKKYMLTLLLLAGMVGGMMVSPVYAAAEANVGAPKPELDPLPLEGSDEQKSKVEKKQVSAGDPDAPQQPGRFQQTADFIMHRMAPWVPRVGPKAMGLYDGQFEHPYKPSAKVDAVAVIKDKDNNGDSKLMLLKLLTKGDNRKLGVRKDGNKSLVAELELDGDNKVTRDEYLKNSDNEDEAPAVLDHGAILYERGGVYENDAKQVLVVDIKGEPLMCDGKLVFVDNTEKLTLKPNFKGLCIDTLVVKKASDGDSFKPKFYDEQGKVLADIEVDDVKGFSNIKATFHPTRAVGLVLTGAAGFAMLAYKALSAGYTKIFGDDEEEDDDEDGMNVDSDEEEEKTVAPVKQQPVQQVQPEVVQQKPVAVQSQQVAPVVKPVEKPVEQQVQPSQPVATTKPAVVVSARPVATVPTQQAQQQPYRYQQAAYPAAARGNWQQAQMNRFGATSATPVSRYGVPAAASVNNTRGGFARPTTSTYSQYAR